MRDVGKSKQWTVFKCVKGITMCAYETPSLKIINGILSTMSSLSGERGGLRVATALKANVCKITNSLYFCYVQMCIVCSATNGICLLCWLPNQKKRKRTEQNTEKCNHHYECECVYVCSYVCVYNNSPTDEWKM